MENLPTRELSHLRPVEVLRCEGCGEAASESDPTWNSDTFHLKCIDIEDVARTVEANINLRAMEEAAVITRMLADDCDRKSNSLRAYLRGKCEFCQGHGRVLASDSPHIVWADCSCRGVR